jgi:molybdopterin synthase catalytic subunit
MKIAVIDQAFDPWQALRQHEVAGAVGSWGATTNFVGAMRDFNEDHSVRSLYLEHYAGMTEKYLEKIAREAIEKWHLLDALIIHRVGEIKTGDAIVLVATWSAHRAEAFEACRYLIDELKHRAPFWKKETLADGQTKWVGKNS